MEVTVFVGTNVAVGNGVREGIAVGVGICDIVPVGEGKAVADGVLEEVTGTTRSGLTARVKVKVGTGVVVGV